MKKIILLALFISLAAVPAESEPVDGQILVELTDPAFLSKLESVDGCIGVRRLIPHVDGSFTLFEYDTDAFTLDEMLSRLNRMGIVKIAEPNMTVARPEPVKFTPVSKQKLETAAKAPQKRTFSGYCPNDSLFSEQWGLQTIHMPELWQVPVTNPKRPVIAIVDSGVDIDHPDLADNIWTNEAELNGLPGVDDDGNGYIDDIHGWNCVDGNNDVTDLEGHGTHCAGIAAAVTDNGIGIAGTNPDALIMPVRIYGKDQSSDATFLEGIEYAIASGADLVNISGGILSIGPEDAVAKGEYFHDAYESACKMIIVVFATGNDGESISEHPQYPAAYPFAIGVESSDQDGTVSDFSNYDENGPWIYGSNNDNYELCAPGDSIISTLPGGEYGKCKGTSMAAPFVSGVISRLICLKDYKSQKELVRSLILSRENSLGPIDAMKAFTDDFGTAAVSVMPMALPNNSRNISLQNVAVINLTDNDMTGLHLTLSLQDPADSTYIRINRDTHEIGILEAGSTLAITSSDIVFSLTEKTVPGSQLPLNLVLSSDSGIIQSVEFFISVDDSYYSTEGFAIVVTDSVASEVQIVSYIGTEKEITIPETVTVDGKTMYIRSIGKGAFKETDITGVRLPETLTSIGESAFSTCEKLKSIEIPSSIETISKYAFMYCLSLESVIFHEGLKTIDICAFFYCLSLSSVVFPESLETVGSMAFESCFITQVTCLATNPPVFDMWAFEDDALELGTLYVPAGCADAYRNAEGWCDFSNIVELEPTSVPSNIKADANDRSYDLNGRPASATDHGIVIRSGKKVLK